MKNRALLINDMAGYGKVALSAMIPILSHMGVELYNLPTALVSNTLDYGKFDILNTTEYMRNTLSVWKELGFSFDAISTGFITDAAQAGLVCDYCRAQSERGVMIFCDPIMGDDGKLYNGMTDETVENMRKLVSCADYIVPNYTEATLLAGAPYLTKPTADQIRALIEKLRQIGSASVVITSVPSDHGDLVACSEKETENYYELPYRSIDVRFPGTGDIFSAVMFGEILRGTPMRRSVRNAMDTVKRMIERNLANQDRYKGIPIETCLDIMNEVAAYEQTQD